jgi:hypothetical protein
MEHESIDKSEFKKFTDLAIAADAKQRTAMKLFNRTELAGIDHTPENIAQAVSVVNVVTDQLQAAIELSVVQRGMYLCWLKVNYAEHGEWEKFCSKNFPKLSERTRRYWMLAYQVAVGEKKPKELPRYEPGEMEDRELQAGAEDLTAKGREVAPRKALLDHIKKLEGNQQKGQEQLSNKDERIAELEKKLETLTTDAFIPADVKDEDNKCQLIKNAFWRFVVTWNSNIPSDPERLKSHMNLCRELEVEMTTLWDEHLFPAFEIARGRAAKNPKR